MAVKLRIGKEIVYAQNGLVFTEDLKELGTDQELRRYQAYKERLKSGEAVPFSVWLPLHREGLT